MSATNKNPVTILYTNYRGETAVRTVAPDRIWFGKTDWHPTEQWLLRAYDFARQDYRDFALSEIKWWGIDAELYDEPSEKVSVARGLYKHFKGEFYEVLDVARDSENEEEFVIYRKLSDNSKWVRSVSMFTETILRDGQTKKRFEIVNQER